MSKHREYSPEFKREAVELTWTVILSGTSIGIRARFSFLHRFMRT